MGFVKIENYDGEKGYSPDDRFPFNVVEMDGIKYLVNFSPIENPSGVAYRIIHEREDTATATTVKNEELLKALEEKYYADLKAMLHEEFL